MKPRHRLAAALALLAAAPAMAQSDPNQLGRLFATPAERALLDSKRGVVAPPAQANVPSPDQPAAMPPGGVAPPPPAALPQPVQLNGLLRSSDGRTTVWLDGAAQNDGAAKLLQDKQVQMRLSSGRRVILKPGQSYNPANGSVQELTTPAPPNQ
jgi:hypothetical protein